MKKATALSAFTLILALSFVASPVGMGRVKAAEAASAQPRADATIQQPRLIAVKFHADWCGYCKAMGPVFEELQAKFDQEPVLYIEFDLTREFDRRQSGYMAHALGLGDIWEKYGGKTGFVLLIDAETKTVVQRLNHEQILKEMGAALQDGVAKATRSGADRP